MRLVTSHIQDIMESTPSACVILKDPVGQWDYSDFEVVWANNVAKEMMPHEVLENLQVDNKAQMNAVQSHVNTIEQLVEAGESGFFGPYPYTTTNSEGNTVHLEFNAMFLGRIDKANVFMVLTQDKTAEVFRQRMEATGHRSQKKPIDRLSDREKSVAILIVEGLTTKQIAIELDVSERTVDNHRANIRRKMNLTDRTISISECLSNF